jgi:3'-phosphoadenosine 5'-phosphosulfate sulfotransferase (PAPS reductase)/FAD synthetase
MNNIPLETKIMTAEEKIMDWYRYFDGKVYVSFSGGKDSTVLLHLVRSIYPDVPAVFCDTGLEYPEIRDFVKTFDNVTWLKPGMNFNKVIEKYGYPVISKEVSQMIYEYNHAKSEYHKNKILNGREKDGCFKIPQKYVRLIDAPFKISHMCCNEMKKKPFHNYEKSTGFKPYIGIMAHESRARMNHWKIYGCNAFEIKNPQSRPLMPWNEEDIYEYAKEFKVDICKIYSMGYKRTGCMFCGFGAQRKGDNRFELMKQTHPKQYDYIMNKMGFKDVLEYCEVNINERN